jgi:hypothetical protein
MRFNVTWPPAWRSETLLSLRALRNLVIQRIALIKGDATMRSAQSGRTSLAAIDRKAATAKSCSCQFLVRARDPRDK